MSRTDSHRPWQIRADDRTERNSRAYFRHIGCWRDDCADCGWTIPHPVLSQPPSWFLHETWFGPERARERINLRVMAKEWNATGDLTDGDFPNNQHRHRGLWLWC